MNLPGDNIETHWGLRLAMLLVIGVASALIAHRWDASARFAENQGLLAHERENVFVDRQESTTLYSAAGYVLFGLAGAVCLLSTRWKSLHWTHPVNLAYLAFLSWALVSLLWSDSPELSFRKATILVLATMGAYGLAARASASDLVWLAIVYFGSAIGVGIVAEIVQGTFRPWAAGYRLTCTQHPNTIGMNAGILCLAAAVMAMRNRNYPWLRWGIVLFAFSALLLTKSRTALAAFLVAAAVVALMRTRAQFRLLVGSLVIALACIVGIAMNFVNSQDVSSVTSAASMGRTEDLNSLTGRIPLWYELSKAAGNRPLLGYGYGSFWSAERIGYYSKRLLWEIPNGHNAYLDLVLNVGVVGLVLYLIWLIGFTLTGAGRFLQSGAPVDLFVVGLVAFAMVHSASESLFLAQGAPSWLLLACAARLALQASSQPWQRAAPQSSSGMAGALS